jgi:hypothetical protein
MTAEHEPPSYAWTRMKLLEVQAEHGELDNQLRRRELVDRERVALRMGLLAKAHRERLQNLAPRHAMVLAHKFGVAERDMLKTLLGIIHRCQLAIVAESRQLGKSPPAES